MSSLNLKLVRTEDFLDTTYLPYVGKDKLMVDDKRLRASLWSYLFPAVALLGLLFMRH